MNTHLVVRSFFVPVLVAGLAATPVPAFGQTSSHAPEAAQIMKADADFAAAVAQRNRERFLSFLADVTTFNGGVHRNSMGAKRL
jgi:hypothetical protein